MHVSMYIYLQGGSLSHNRRHQPRRRPATGVQGAAPYVTNTFIIIAQSHIYVCIYVYVSSRRFVTEPSSPPCTPSLCDRSPRCGPLRDQSLSFKQPMTHIYMYLCTSSRRFAIAPSSPPTAPLPRDRSPSCGSLRA